MGIFSIIGGFFTSQSDSFSEEIAGPRVNIDGAPMIGAIDINGNPFGTTESNVGTSDDSSSSFDSSSFGGVDDDFSSSFSSDDSFDSNCDSSSSDSFSSSWDD